MPFYKFTCVCGHATKTYLAKPGTIPCPDCSLEMTRLYGDPSVLQMETTDSYRGKKRFEGTERKRIDRTDEHFAKVTLPRLIEQHGVKYAEQRGWVDSQGNIKKK